MYWQITRDITHQDMLVSMQICDTIGGGFHGFHTLFKGSDVCLLMFDIGNKQSFDALYKYLQDAKIDFMNEVKEMCIFMVIAHKCDKLNSNATQVQVTEAQVQQFV